jgi:DNA-binding GntR family transcriptional regulator
VVSVVFDEILDAVMRGELLPGQRISDAVLAQQYGVSRTPVREALQRLRDIGVIEASPSRFTRVAEVTPLQTLHAFIVWQALYAALLEEVIPSADPALAEALRDDHLQYREAVSALAAQRIATANFLFFMRLAQQTQNPTLLRSIVSVVHIIRLGSLHLPDYIDFESLGRAHELVIEAVELRDLDSAREAISVLRSIRIPLE